MNFKIENKTQQSINKNVFIRFFSYLCYIIFVIQGFLGSLGGSVVEISYFLIILLPLCLLLRNINRIVLIIIVCIPLYFINKSFITIFIIYALVYLLRNESLAKIACVNIFISLSVLLLIPILLEEGIVKDQIANLNKGVAHSMGFGNANSFGLEGFYLIVSLYIFLVKRCKWIMLILILIINHLFYTLACSRTAWIAGIVLILTSFVIFVFGINKKFRYIIASIPILSTCIIYFILFNWHEYGMLDVFLSRRISILGGIIDSFSKYNWLFGRNIEDGIAIDCAYVGIVIAGGIGWLIFFLITEWSAIVHRYKYIYIYIPVLCSMFVSGIGENSFISPNGATIIFWSIILHSNEKSKTKHTYTNVP